MTGPARRMAAGLLVGVLAAGLVAACSDDGEEATPEPVPRPSTTTTTRVDLSGVHLAPAPGSTTTTVTQVGRAVIVGTVRGPIGAVPGAVVRVERLGPGGGVTDLVADEAGRFEQRGIPGGRYRLRAFLPPALAQIEPEVRFLADAQEHAFDLVVTEHGGPSVLASVAPEAPMLGQPVNLVVQVGTRRVDGDGIVRTEPVGGLRVELAGLGRWQLLAPASTTTTSTSTTSTTSVPDSDDTTTTSTSTSTTTTTTRPVAEAAATTDAAGRVRFSLACRAPGAPGLSVRFEVRRPAPPVPPTAPEPPGEGEPPPTTTTGPQTVTEVVALDLPACTDPAATTTVPPDAPDGGGDAGDG